MSLAESECHINGFNSLESLLKLLLEPTVSLLPLTLIASSRYQLSGVFPSHSQQGSPVFIFYLEVSGCDPGIFFMSISTHSFPAGTQRRQQRLPTGTSRSSLPPTPRRIPFRATQHQASVPVHISIDTSDHPERRRNYGCRCYVSTVNYFVWNGHSIATQHLDCFLGLVQE